MGRVKKKTNCGSFGSINGEVREVRQNTSKTLADNILREKTPIHVRYKHRRQFTNCSLTVQGQVDENLYSLLQKLII